MFGKSMRNRASALLVAGCAGLSAGVVAPAVAHSAPSEEAAPALDAMQKPSWEEFESETHVDSDGQYIVDGDIPIADEKELREFYEAMPWDSHESHIADLLANKNDRGRPKLWSKEHVGNLTYCVSDKFGDLKETIVDATASGAANWEDASPAIDFRYLPGEDADCDTDNSNVMFSIEPTKSENYVARAFLPGASKSAKHSRVADRGG